VILETLRIVREALDDPEIGVNAVLPSIPVEDGDPTPLPIRTIWDQTQAAFLVTEERPLEDPWIVVYQDGPATMAGEVRTVTRDGDAVRIAIAYGTSRAVADTVPEVLVVLRAIVRSLRLLLAETNRPRRTRNNVFVMSCASMQVGPTDGPLDVQGAVVCDFYVRDTSP
jgi:hypothetical protein